MSTEKNIYFALDETTIVTVSSFQNAKTLASALYSLPFNHTKLFLYGETLTELTWNKVQNNSVIEVKPSLMLFDMTLLDTLPSLSDQEPIPPVTPEAKSYNLRYMLNDTKFIINALNLMRYWNK